jgi:hypothetical protein
LAVFDQSEILGGETADCDGVPEMRIVSDEITQRMLVIFFARQVVEFLIENYRGNQNLMGFNADGTLGHRERSKGSESQAAGQE